MKKLIFLLMIFSLLFLFSCAFMEKESVTYEVDGTSDDGGANADITYTDETGTSITANSGLPWSTTVSITYGEAREENGADISSAYLSATYTGEANVTLTTTITWNK